MLYRILNQTEAELQRFSKYADGSIADSQTQLIKLAQAHTADIATKAAGKRLQGATWRKLPTSQLEDLVGITANGSPVYTILKKLVPAGVDKVRDSLVNGIAVGKTPTMIAKELRDELGGNLGRFITVATTEDQRAYRSSSFRSMKANDAIIDGWTWHAALSSDTCLSCLAMHGTVHPLTEELESHPNCRCQAIPNVKGYDNGVESGADWLKRQDEDVQRRAMSPAKYELYASGKVELSDFVATRHSETWGNTRYEKPLADLS